MAETAQELRNRIMALESRIKELEAQLYRSSQQMGDILSKQTQVIRNQTSLQVGRDFQTAFSSEAERLNRSYSEQLEKLRAESAKTEKRIKKLEESAEEERAELYKKLAKLTGSDSAKRRQADDSFKSLRSEIASARQSDTECFYPRKLQIYLDAADQIENLMNRCLYSEAISVSESALLGVKRLKNDSERKARLFEMYLKRYEALCAAAHEIIVSEAAHTMYDEDGETLYRLSAYGLDYWSDGLFYRLLQILLEHVAIIERINSEGVKHVTDSGESDPIRYIREQGDKIMNLPGCFRIAVSYAFSSLDCYEYSLSIKKIAEDVLRPQGFMFDHIAYGCTSCALGDTPGYRKYYEDYLRHERAIGGTGKPDYREERRLVFKRRLANSKTEYVYIRIIPVRNRETVGCRTELIVETDEERTRLSSKLACLLRGGGLSNLTAAVCISSSEAPESLTRPMQLEEVIEIAALNSSM